VADADYGTTTGFRTGLERLGLRYAVAVRSLLHAWASGRPTSCSLEAMGRALPRQAWRTVTWGQGTKAAGRALRRPTRPARHGRGERWVLFRAVARRRHPQYYVLNLEPTAALTPIAAGAQSLAHRAAIPGTERTNWGWTTSRGALPRLGPPHRADRGGVHLLQLERRQSADAPRPTLPAVRNVDAGNRCASVLCGNRQLFNLALSFQRNPPLRR